MIADCHYCAGTGIGNPHDDHSRCRVCRGRGEIETECPECGELGCDGCPDEGETSSEAPGFFDYRGGLR